MSNHNHASGDAPSHEMLQQAAHWFSVISDDQVSESDNARWQAWLNQHPQHRVAWGYVETVSQRLQQAQQQAGAGTVSSSLKVARRDRLNRRRILQGGGVLCLALLSWRYGPLYSYGRQFGNQLIADHHTVTGEVKALSLQDEGQLWLNTRSAVDISYTAAQRRVQLRHGEILIQTAPDSRQRPFIVSTRYGQLRALGTRFSVQEQANHGLLAVYEGAVEIQTEDGQRQVIPQGQQVRFNHQQIETPQPADRAREAWSRGIIEADNITLAELVTELSRYRTGHLGLNPALADIRVIGAYPIDQPDHALFMLAQSLPLTVEQTLPWWVSLEPK